MASTLEIKLHHVRRGEHIHTTVFARWFDGTMDITFQRLGVIVGDVGQYQLIWAALGLGATQTCGRLTLLPDAGWNPKECDRCG